MVIKLIRRWLSQDGKATIGQDKNGNIYARCNKCQNNMAVIIDYPKTISKRIPIRVVKCPKCNNLTRL